MAIDRQPWRSQAKCKDLSSQESDSIFFVVKGGSTTRAEKYCGDCPVKMQCLAFAIVHDEDGIWAGTSPRERARMKMDPNLVTHLLTYLPYLENRESQGKRLNIPERQEELAEVLDISPRLPPDQPTLESIAL